MAIGVHGLPGHLAAFLVGVAFTLGGEDATTQDLRMVACTVQEMTCSKTTVTVNLVQFMAIGVFGGLGVNAVFPVMEVCRKGSGLAVTQLPLVLADLVLAVERTVNLATLTVVLSMVVLANGLSGQNAPCHVVKVRERGSGSALNRLMVDAPAGGTVLKSYNARWHPAMFCPQ